MSVLNLNIILPIEKKKSCILQIISEIKMYDLVDKVNIVFSSYQERCKVFKGYVGNWIFYNLNHQGVLVAQMVKHLPAVQETQVASLGWEDPLEKRMETYFSILAQRISWTGAWWATVDGVTKSQI